MLLLLLLLNNSTPSRVGLPLCLVIGAHVDSHGNVPDEPLLQDSTEELEVEHGHVAIVEAVLEDLQRVVPVPGSTSLSGGQERVGVVRVQLVDLVVDGVVEEELTSVDQATTGEGSIGESLPVGVNLDVDVGGSTSVVARVDTREFSDAVGVGRQSSSQPSLLEVLIVSWESGEQTLSDSSRRWLLVLQTLLCIRVSSVVSRRVGSPQVDQHVLDGLTRLNVDDPYVHQEQETQFILCHVASNRVTLSVVVRSFGRLWRQDARGVADLGVLDRIAGHDLLLLVAGIDVVVFVGAVDKVLLGRQWRSSEHFLGPVALALGSVGCDCWGAVVGGSLACVECLDLFRCRWAVGWQMADGRRQTSGKGQLMDV